MLLATVLLLCPFSQNGFAVKSAVEQPAIVSQDAAKDSSATSSTEALPAAPEAKVKTDAEVANDASSAPLSSSASVAPVAPAAPSPAVSPVKPAGRGDDATGQDKKTWYALIAVSSGAALLDAYSTRRAISEGAGTEANPLLRPFAHSNAMYAAVQVSPVVMDVIGRKMMTSSHHWMRKLWWAPQMAGTDVSVSAAIHNLSVAH
jgi:hypothetical protein